MTILLPALAPATGRAFSPTFALDGATAPAVFADDRARRLTPRYRFISTSQVVDALLEAGFEATGARHLVRLRRARETLVFADAIPEIVLLNAHDGSRAYQLRAGLFRPVCLNGLLARVGDFGFVSVPHRASAVADVVEASLRLAAHFDALGGTVRRMADRRRRSPDEHALRIRHPDLDRLPYAPMRLLEARREADAGESLWQVDNVVQENLMRGGLPYASTRGRAMRSRQIDPDLVGRIPDGDPVVAFRNVLAHGYATLDHARVYQIASESAPEICRACSTSCQPGLRTTVSTKRASSLGRRCGRAGRLRSSPYTAVRIRRNPPSRVWTSISAPRARYYDWPYRLQ